MRACPGEITLKARSSSGARSRQTAATISAFVSFDKPAKAASINNLDKYSEL